MRTWLVLAAVLAIGAAAGADALHGSLDRASPQAARAPVPAWHVVPPGVPAGYMGAVYYSDQRDDCRLKTLALPGFESAQPPKLRSCRFSLSPDGTQAIPGDAEWSPRGGLVVIPFDETSQLVSRARHQTILIPGRAPAFKPDGTVTYVRGRRLVEWSSHCGTRTRLFTASGDDATARCIRTVWRRQVTSVAWLTNTRFVSATPNGEIVIVDQGRIVSRRRLPAASDVRLELSPLRTFFTVWLDGVLFGGFDEDGGQMTLPPIAGVSSLAWAPTERWGLLVSARGSVYLFRPDAGDARLRRLDIKAADLAWR